MRFEKFTNRLQQALSDAQSLAIGKDHTAIEGIHLLATLLEEAPMSVYYNKQAPTYVICKANYSKRLPMHRLWLIQQAIST